MVSSIKVPTSETEGGESFSEQSSDESANLQPEDENSNNDVPANSQDQELFG